MEELASIIIAFGFTSLIFFLTIATLAGEAESILFIIATSAIRSEVLPG